jgi:uncharacterized membrane protein
VLPDKLDDDGGKGHLETLVHGIFAITMTLLILDLRLDEGRRAGELWPALQDLAPQAVAYAYGFAYLLSNWLSVTDLFRVLRRVDKVVSLLVLIYVALLSLTPFLVSTVAASVHNAHDLGVATRLMAVVVGLGYVAPVLVNAYGVRRGYFKDVGFVWHGMSVPVLLGIACGPAVAAFVVSYLWAPLGLTLLTADTLVGLFLNTRRRPDEASVGPG